MYRRTNMAAATNPNFVNFDQLSEQFHELYSHPESYLDPTESLHGSLIASSKHLYDLMKDFESENALKTSSLKELLTDNFDNEQIWQELQLQNTPSLKQFKSITKTLGSSFSLNAIKIDNELPVKKRSKKSKKKSVKFQADAADVYDDEDVDEVDFLKEESCVEPNNKQKKYQKTVVDDTFFKLREMEEFLDEQDRKEQLRKDGELSDGSDDIDDSIDLFKDDDKEEDGKAITNITYKDFFGLPPKKNSHSDKPDEHKELNIQDEEKEIEEEEEEEEEGEEEEYDDENDELMDGKSEGNTEGDQMEINDEENEGDKSNFERKQDEMMKKIKRLEETNLTDKPWQLKGETTSKQRPTNSLLEEHVTFDHTSVGAPVITEETTETLEDLIKQRVKDQAWDDVQRKQKPTTQPFEYKKAPELNMEKSKLSLADVYEKEYLMQAEDNKEEKENEDHVLIKNLMDKLFVKLDSLSNFYFTPKPPKPELKIVTNTPSLQMEEVTPITMTTASQLAPEEIYDKKKGDVKGDGEKEDEDRKRERRQKKLKKKFAAEEKEKKEKLKAKTGKVTKSSKKKAIDSLKKGTRNTILTEKNAMSKSVKSSNEFFTRLQDEAKKSITKQKDSTKDTKMKKNKRAEFLKL